MKLFNLQILEKVEQRKPRFYLLRFRFLSSSYCLFFFFLFFFFFFIIYLDGWGVFSEVVIKSAGNELSLASSAYFMQNATSCRFSIWNELQNVKISNIAVSPRITCYSELGGSGNSEVNNGRHLRLGSV